MKVGERGKITLCNGLEYTGKVVKEFPANEPISDADLEEYFSIGPSHKHYKSQGKPIKLNRYAILKDGTNYHLVISENVQRSYFKWEVTNNEQ